MSAEGKRGRRGARRGGSALVIAIWTIGLLSLLVMSFALDAMLEGKINVYVRQRRRVDYLTQSGVAIAEMLLLEYKSASDSSQTEEETDKWLEYKLNLQRGSTTVRDYAVEPDHPENGTVTVEISSAESDRWPVNLLVAGDKADQIWENVLNVIGLPMEYQEEVVDSWYDWRDADSTVTGSRGAEDEYYDGLKTPYKARNGEIASVDELKLIKGIRDYPAIFSGGVLEKAEEDEGAPGAGRAPKRKAKTGEERPEKTGAEKKPEPGKTGRTGRKADDEVVIQYGLAAFFDIYGENVKINVNSASKEVLMTVPGIDGDEEVAGAIVEERTTGANRVDVIAEGTVESLLFKDWNDLNARIPGGLPTECEPFLSYAPETFFEIKITGRAAGITHSIATVAVVRDDEVRYVRWREDP